MKQITEEQYEGHRRIATQVEALYREIEKLAKRKPTERITPLISKKINHAIRKIREQVNNDEFLDAIETVPVEGQQIRLDESLLLLSELKGTLDRQWHTQGFKQYRQEKSKHHESQVMR